MQFRSLPCGASVVWQGDRPIQVDYHHEKPLAHDQIERELQVLVDAPLLFRWLGADLYGNISANVFLLDHARRIAACSTIAALVRILNDICDDDLAESLPPLEPARWLRLGPPPDDARALAWDRTHYCIRVFEHYYGVPRALAAVSGAPADARAIFDEALGAGPSRSWQHQPPHGYSLHWSPSRSGWVLVWAADGTDLLAFVPPR
jgi:hypothetical protein